MSPTRLGSTNSSRRNSSGGFKPYTRGVTPIMVPSMSMSLSDPGRTGASPSDRSTPNANVPVFGYGSQPINLERPGFPTYVQYKQVETAYLHSLTPRRQGKALISQSLFDRIWDVLHQPDSHNETAQFRFWARKMFTLSKTHRVTLGSGAMNDGNSDLHISGEGQEVLLHDNLLVAIQEQLYDLLCYCHGSTGHGGRDKTCALIRKHYTWVPKDLVSNFIKACPTCIMKKCGNADANSVAAIAAQAQAHAAHVQSQSQACLVGMNEEMTMPIMKDCFQQHSMYGSPSQHQQEGSPILPHPDSLVPASGSVHGTTAQHIMPWPTTGGPRDSPTQPLSVHTPMTFSGSTLPQGLSPSLVPSHVTDEHDPLEAVYRDILLKSRGLRSASMPMPSSSSSNLGGSPGMQHPHPYTVHGGLPMSREVSLFKGLPNGWQYRHRDYASAHAEFMRTKEEVMDMEIEHEHRNGNAFSSSDEMEHSHSDVLPHSHHYQRPRIPSIVPLWGPNDFPYLHQQEHHDEYSQTQSVPGDAGEVHYQHGMAVGHMYSVPMAMSMAVSMARSETFEDDEMDMEMRMETGREVEVKGLQHHYHDHLEAQSRGDGGLHQQQQHPALTMQYLLMSSTMSAESPLSGSTYRYRPEEVGNTNATYEYIPQIDPLLLEACVTATASLSESSATAQSISTPGPAAPDESRDMFTSVSIDDHDQNGLPSVAHPNPHAQANLRLNLSNIDFTAFPLSSEKSFQALLAYRDSLGEGNLTPDSPTLGLSAVLGSASSTTDCAMPIGVVFSINHVNREDLKDSEKEKESTRPDATRSASSSTSTSSDSGSSGSSFPLIDTDVDTGYSTSSTTATTPGSSVLTTPVDECSESVLGVDVNLECTSVEAEKQGECDVDENEVTLKTVQSVVEIIEGFKKEQEENGAAMRERIDLVVEEVIAKTEEIEIGMEESRPCVTVDA